jgi:hypothetical protein
LIEQFLLENIIIEVADFALGYVKDKNSERYLITYARIRIL